MMGRVDGNIAIVIGSAKGLGAAAAKLLFKEGATLVFTDRDDEAGKATVDSIGPSGARACFMEQDVTDESRWKAVVQETVRWFGKIDVLVNNAGVGALRTVEDETYERWKWFQSINLDSVFLGAREAIATMKTTGGGSIINHASIEALIGDPLLAAYNASKGDEVRCGAQWPVRIGRSREYGLFRPYRHADVPRGCQLDTLPQRNDGRADALHPIGPLDVPNDVAYAVLYLSSDESSFVTGATLAVDGGYTAQ